MAAVPLLMEPRGIPTIFGEVCEKNVTFCVDTSGSMYKGLEMVKEHLIETLLKHANKGKPTMFNIVEFNSEVTQWADKMVTCTPQTVAVAKDWINKLSAKTGTNTKDALLTALGDPLCEAVCLVTDGLPDHHPAEILDHVTNIGKLRPIHCIYLSTDETTESAATEFLEDLAVESYGSLHIVCLTTHGCVEKIEPIYRADHANERVIRTLNGAVYSPDIKQCTVATTLQVDPDESLRLTPRLARMGPPPYYYPPWFDWLSMPHRYYYPHGWSRYRPARGWLKAQEEMMESIETSGVSPAAGSLLINKTVLARRLDDGYFYMGTVKSQILSDKFLVAFGPNKHGKFKETAYQDTFLYDIIDYEDAKRHTILTGDRVLAPWEPEGERYGPGVVLEGHEKRQAKGPDDREITVSFTNGKVEKVPFDTAAWLPTEVYERLALELKMPKEAREALSAETSYPKDTLEGYPTSGPHASPAQYDLSKPVYFDVDPLLVEGRPWRYPYFPTYPVIFKRDEERVREPRARAKTEVNSEDINALVPGTNITQKELDQRIMSQLNEHKLLLDERETEKGTYKDEKDQDETLTVEKERELQRRLEERRREWEREQDMIEREIERERLLKKRDKQEENMLKKSVSFKDELVEEETGLEKQYTDMSLEASSRDMPIQTDPLYLRSEEAYFSDPEESMRSRSRGVNTDARLLYQPRSRLVSRHRRPAWKKYWRSDPSMPVTNSVHGPFRETALQAPLEARCQRNDPYYNCDWTSPVYKYVDPMAKHEYSDSVEKLMKVPAQLPDRPLLRPQPPERPMSADTKEAARREFKRRREEQRQTAWNMRMAGQDQMAELMKDQHRERIQEQISREKNRQYEEQRMVELSREAKKHISKELREKIETNQKQEVAREEQRLKAMQIRREHREEVQKQREKAIEETVMRRAEIKAQRSQERWDNVQKRLDAEEAETTRKKQQFQDAKINRIRHFQNLEEQGQQRKDMRIGVSDRHLSMFQSVVM